MERLADAFSRMLSVSGCGLRHLGRLTGREMNRSTMTILRGDDFRMSTLLDIAHALGYRVDVRFMKRLETTAVAATAEDQQIAA